MIGELLENGFEVFAIEHRTPVSARPGLSIIKGGIKAIDKDLIRSVRPDCLFHLGRPTFPRLRRTGRTLAAWYAARLNRRLISTLEQSSQPVKLVFASGSLMYGSSELPCFEDAPLNPESYARQYYPGEAPVLNALKAGRLPVMVLRFPWLLGKGSWFDWFYIRTMQNYRIVPLFGKGDNMMDLLDIRDAAAITARIISETNLTGVCNMVTAGHTTQLEFASMLSGISGLPVRDHRQAFKKDIEKEAYQAFTSNILLATRYELPAPGHRYIPMEETLKELLTGYGLGSGRF